MSLYQKYFALPYGVCQRYAFALYSSDELLYGPITVCMGDRESCPAWNRIDSARAAITSDEAGVKDVAILSRQRLASRLKFCRK